MKKLKVPYKSQHDRDAQKARGDCVETSYSMIYEYITGQSLAVDKIVTAAGPNLGSTTVPEIQKAAKQFGLELLRVQGNGVQDLRPQIDNGKPPIIIIDYSKIPQRQDKNYTGGHAVVVVGYDSGGVFVNDPDHWGYQRKTEKWQLPEFHNAWLTTAEKGISKNGTMLVPERGKDLVNYKGQLKECRKEKEKYKGFANKLRAARNKWRKKAKELKQEVEQLEKKLTTKSARIRELNSLVSGLKRDKKKFQRRFLDASEKNDQLNKELAKCKRQRAGLSKDLEKARSEYLEKEKSLKSHIETLKTEIGDLERKIDSLEKEVGSGNGEMSEFYKKWSEASGWSWVIEGLKKIRR